MSALNTSSRSRRVTDGTSSGKRGRPESIVRQYWEDIDVDGVGPKCMFCSHRSVTRLFRAPPATRHTLICKNAPEHVKEKLRRVTNNKYSRRPPLATDASAAAAAAAAAVANKVLPPQSQQLQPPQQQQQQNQLPQVQNTQHHQPTHPHTAHHQQTQPQHHQPGPNPGVVHQQQPHPAQHHPSQHLPHHSQPQPQPPPQHVQAARGNPQATGPAPPFAFKHSSPASTDPSAHNQDPTSIPNLSSPRHISSVVTTINGASPTPLAAPVDTSGVPATVRSALLGDHRGVAAATSRSMGLTTPLTHNATLSPGAPDLLYAGGTGQRLSLGTGAEELGAAAAANGLDRANAALAAAVVEAMFGPTSGRKKEGAVPTPAEFRAALQDVKDSARSKAKRQRNEARALVARLEHAISLLVGSKTIGGAHGRQVDSVESDDSDDDLMGTAAGAQGVRQRVPEWGNGFDRTQK